MPKTILQDNSNHNKIINRQLNLRNIETVNQDLTCFTSVCLVTLRRGLSERTEAALGGRGAGEGAGASTPAQLEQFPASDWVEARGPAVGEPGRAAAVHATDA